LATSIASPTDTSGRSRPAVVVLVIVALAASAWLAAGVPLFRARSIRVGGVSRLESDRVARLAGISSATNVLMLDATAAERAIEAHPWVANADVERHLPSTVDIRVRERAPVATASVAGETHLLAGDGTDLGPPGRAAALPSVEPARARTEAAWWNLGLATAGARAIAAVPAQARRSIVAARIAAHGGIDLALRGGAAVALGPPTELGAKGRALSAILRWAGEGGEGILVADLRSPRAPTARLSSGAVLDG